MEKLVLINWTDKKSVDVCKKLFEIQTKSDISVENFSNEITKVQSDNSITISHSFNPNNFKV